MILDRARSQLLVVDVQERLMPAMHEGERMADRCGILMQAAHRLGIPVTISEQYRKGLGPTIARLGNLAGDTPVFEKMHFSCSEDEAIRTRVDSLADTDRTHLVICGIESHVCVLQSALGFRDRLGLQVAVVADAVTSRQPASVSLAFDRMRAADVAVVNTEMALFEWMNRAGTPEFKELSSLIK
jgi:nicotinamidase-related amidase